MSLQFYALTKVTKGAYLGFTPRSERQFLLVSYWEDGSGQTGDGKTLKGTYWMVLVPARGEATASTDGVQGNREWFEALNEDLLPEGWSIQATTFRTRYQARNWAEANL